MAQPQTSQRFKLDRTVRGDVTLLHLHGVIDETFEGRKAAETIKTGKVVLNLQDVRRFASWGMAEWMDFVRGNASRSLYVVECSTQALNQFGLVTGLLGHGKLVSFYVPYRCASCGEELQSLIIVPLDRASLRDLGDSEHLCRTCNGTMRFDQHVAAVSATIAGHPAFDIDDDVVELLRSDLKYNVSPDVNRFRAYRLQSKEYTYLRLSGDVAGLSPEPLRRASEGTTIIDLAGVTVHAFDEGSLAPWRSYLDAVVQQVPAVQLLDCPVGFLEAGLQPDDLQRVKVRTFALGHHCATCSATATTLVDVAATLEHLVEGKVPAQPCGTCKTPMTPLVSPALDRIIRRLPARDQDATLEKLLAKARRENPKNLEDALALRPAVPVKPTSKGPRILYIAVVLLVLIAAGVTVILWRQQQRENEPVAVAPTVTPPIVPPQPPQPTFQRPDWIVSDQPGTAFCQDLVSRFVCVGVSMHRPTRNDAVGEANEAALEELLNTVALKITEPGVKGTLPIYVEGRTKALAALQADVDRNSEEYIKVSNSVRDTRKHVVELLRASGGPAVPAQRSDWYWEEYARESGPGTETLVFVRYDVTNDAVKSLVERYSTTATVDGTTVATAFPSMAWRHTDFNGGVVVTKPSRALTKAGIAVNDVITAVREEPITDAATFAKQFTGTGNLTVRSGDAMPKVIRVR
jgi:hypothetical protein